MGSAVSLFLVIRYQEATFEDSTIGFRVEVHNDDRNQDGVTDLLTIEVMRDGRRELWYSHADDNFDGSMAAPSLELGNEVFLVAAFDDDGDKDPDHLGIAIRRGASEWGNYQDYDFDGVLDAMHRTEKPGPVALESHILLDGCWTSIVDIAYTEGEWRAYRDTTENAKPYAVFSNSRWVLAGEATIEKMQ